ncbi:CoA-binding protein, partial [Mycobacterium sp.]
MIGRPDDTALRSILRQTRSIAVVGTSANPSRPSYEIYSYLISTDQYRVFAVNPTITDIDGTPVYSSLADLPVSPDLVNVFRRLDEVPSVLADVLALPQRPTTLWLQQGLWHEQVGGAAAAAGMQVVVTSLMAEASSFMTFTQPQILLCGASP